MVLTDKSFKKSVDLILRYASINNEIPIKLEFSTGKVLYFDTPKFQSYADDKMNQPDLIAYTECDGLYRNKATIVLEKTEIESGTLFLLKNNRFLLVDEDAFFYFIAPDDNFLEI
jgi:hypothetical protein